MENKNKTILKIILIVASVVLIISFLLFVIKVPYSYTEYYTEQEPYETTEYYWVKEPYTAYQPIEYRVLERSYRDYFWSSGCDVWIEIQNIDNVGGYFSVDFDVTTSKGDYKTTSERYFIASGDKQYFIVSFKGYYKKSDYDVNYPKKEVTEYRNVRKSRTITKWKPVQKPRTITKYCNLWKRIGGMC